MPRNRRPGSGGATAGGGRPNAGDIAANPEDNKDAPRRDTFLGDASIRSPSELVRFFFLRESFYENFLCVIRADLGIARPTRFPWRGNFTDILFKL